MIFIEKQNTAQILFLEILSLTPIIIMLGNIVPPFPLKIHFIGMGILFLLTLWILSVDGRKKWLLYVVGFFVLVQFTFEHQDWKNVIDFLFGPLVLAVMLDLLFNQKVPEVVLQKYTKRFFNVLWIPIIIAVLQFFGLFPLTFWNATYVNSTKIEGVSIPRPNGLLYHGAELSVLICFMTLSYYFASERRSFWTIFALIGVALMTYYKALLGCIVLLFLFYIAFINRGPLSRFRIVSKERIVIYGGIILIISGIVAFRYLSMMHYYTGYYFHSELLTGRGAIWNIYLDGIKDYSFWNYLVGSGMGSAFDIFRAYATPENFYYLRLSSKLYYVFDPHNVFLSVFINSGLAGILFFVFLFKMVYTQVKQWEPSVKWNKMVFIAVFILPLITIGITIPIYEMAIFWACLSFLIFKWKFYVKEKHEAFK